MKKLAIITTHPVQYNAPLFSLLHRRGNVCARVFYTWGEDAKERKFDPGFGKIIQWDIPLLEGYDFTFVYNSASNPGSHHFHGIDNPTLVKEIEAWGAEAVLIYGWSFKSHLKAMRYFKNKIPVFFRGDSTLLDDTGRPIKNFLKTFFLRNVYKNIDVAFFTGTANKRYFEKYCSPKVKLLFAPHAIDNSRFAGCTGQPVDLRSQLKIPPNAIVFLFAGKLEPKKNPVFLATVFATLQDKDVHLVIAGNGILEEKLKQQFSSNTHIHFLPFQNQSLMPLLYKSADVFVLPSSGPGESWGLSINEAMACGRAVLVSDACGAATDLVKEGDNGFVFRNGDAKDLMEKLRLLARKATVKEMGRQSAQIITNWTMEKVCESLEQMMMTIKTSHQP